MTTLLVIVLSLVLIYFLGSSLVSLILELWSYVRPVRENFLEKKLTEKVGEGSAKAILTHPLVAGSSGKRPKSISSKTFGACAAANLYQDSTGVLNSAVVAHGNINSPPSTLESGEGSGQESALSSWFDEFSSEMSTDYRNYLRGPSLLIATLLVVLLNLDTLGIVSYFWNDRENSSTSLATLTTLSANTLSNFNPDSMDGSNIDDQIVVLMQLIQQLDSLEQAGFPIGWQTGEDLGLVIAAYDTSTTITFQEVTSTDSIDGKEVTTTTFQYIPPTGTAAYQPLAEMEKTPDTLKAIFGTTVPDPFPTLDKDSTALTLNLGGVLASLKPDTLGASFAGIMGQNYNFQAFAHADEVPPGFFRVVWENIQSITLFQFLGWIISILAIGLGASFWYDVLSRITNLITRSSSS